MSAPRLRLRWWAAAGIAAALVTGAHLLLPPVRGGTGRSFWLGVAAASLVLFCALLGARKRFLRVRLGPVARWVSPHNALGSLALVLALLHCNLQLGGPLTGALLVTLALSTISGLVGAALHFGLPRLMTSRLSLESPRRDFRAALIRQWRRVHDRLVKECGPLEGHEEGLLRAERRVGIPPPRLSTSSMSASGVDIPKPTADQLVIVEFYVGRIIPYLRAPSSRHALWNESDSRLAFDTLRASVEPSLHPLVSDLEDILADARTVTEERLLHRLLFDWQLLHIPLAVLVVLLTAVHGFAALYY